MLLLLSRAAARSSQEHVPARFGSFLSTTLAGYIARPPLGPSLSQYSSAPLWQRRAGAGAFTPAGCSKSSGVQGCSAHSSQLSRVLFQRNVWGSGRGWVRNLTKKDVASLRPMKNTLWGGFRGSRTRRFGGGSYVDPQLALGALIATNVGVFCLWRSLGGHFMQSNFVVSAQALKEGRLHTLVTSLFSQDTFQHLLSNMIGLYFFGSEIGNLFGGQRLILLYLAGGIVGSLTHLAYWAYVMPWIKGYPQRLSWHSSGLLGSSGAVNAIILLDILLFPTRIVYLNFIIPVPAALLGIGIIGSDLWAARDGSKYVTSAAAHLGGAFVGVIAWLRWR